MRNNILAASVMAVLLCGAAFADVSITAENFPDESFRDYVSSNFDLDEDGVLNDEEIASVLLMDVSYHYIASLQGIEYFTSLVSLDCSNNYLTGLDVPSSVISGSFSPQFVLNKIITLSVDAEYPYHLDLNSIITSPDNFARAHNLSALNDSSSDIALVMSGGTVCFAVKPQVLSYDYEVSSGLPYMNVTVNLRTAPVIITQSLPSGKVGVSYDAAIRASGDIPFYVSVENIPAGLLSMQREIGVYSFMAGDVMQSRFYRPSMSILGTPAESGSFDITAYVSNDWGEDTKTLTLYIAPANVIFISADEVVAVDAEHFPDNVFRQYILVNYDTDGSGILDEAEIAAIEKFPAGFTYTADPATGITVTNYESLNITDLTGIEYFTNLKTICIPSGVTSVDMSGNVSLDAFFAEGGELEYLDLSENSQLRVVKAHTPAIEPCIAPLLERNIMYLDVSSSDLTQLNLDGTSLDYLACSPQNHSGTMSTDSSAEYPYSFDFRTIVSEDNLGRIIPGSIQILDENGGTITDYLSDNWIYRFRTPPHTIKYKYDTGALGITMDVTITMKYEYLIVRPVFTFSSKDIPEGTTGKAYSLDMTVSGTAPFRWRITGGKLPGGLTLGETTGRISGTPTESGSFTVTISVSNSVYTVSITVTIVIREAVTAPVLSAVTLDTGTVSEYYSFTLKAVGTGITWSISGNPSWLHINASTGEIYGTPARAGTFTFTVTATNSAGSVSREYTLIIRGGSTTTTTGPTITTTSITGGTVSNFYRFVFTAAGTGTITWYLVSGTLPAGLTLNTDGTLTGTPTEDGTFTFTVGAYDSTGIRTTRTYTITINAGSDSEAPRITASSPLPDGTAGTAYSYQLTASGTSPLTWRVSGGSLPPGLSLSSSGLISGTPTTAGVFRFTVIVQNIHGEYMMEFTITIRAGSGIKPDITAIYTLANGYIGVRYSAVLYAEGTRAISWRLTAGNLPAGLTLNANGTVTGTPTAAGEYVFTVEAVNDWGNDIAVFRITIYTDEGQCCNNQSEDVSGGLIYEYRRTTSSLTEYELAMLPSDIYIIAYVLPRFRVTVAGTYRFTVNLYNTVPSGLTLVWFPFAVNGSGGGTAHFWDYRGVQEITVSPDNRRLIVSVYLDADTYAPVIAVLRPSEPESADPEPEPEPEPQTAGGSGEGGGCSTAAGMQMFCAAAVMLMLRRR